jgi:hypothetical protein
MFSPSCTSEQSVSDSITGFQDEILAAKYVRMETEQLLPQNLLIEPKLEVIIKRRNIKGTHLVET